MKGAALLLSLLALAGCPTEQVELLPDQARAVDDAGPPDDAAPDLRPSCVCRYPCRNTECPGLIDPGSTCVMQVCTGGVGSCSRAADCTATGGGLCTIAPDSLTACP